jgi:hypothetical protein
MQTLFSLLGYSVFHQIDGGAERDRTADPLLAKQVLSQLSYSPNLFKPLQATNLRNQRSVMSISGQSRDSVRTKHGGPG